MPEIPEACPKCGGTEAITKGSASGPISVSYDLADRTVSYRDMHESITYRSGTILYCQSCGKRLGRVEDAGDFREDD